MDPNPGTAAKIAVRAIDGKYVKETTVEDNLRTDIYQGQFFNKEFDLLLNKVLIWSRIVLMNIHPTDLRRVSVFQNATDDDLNQLLEHGILRSIEEGEFFFFQGDPANYLYILVSGRAKLMQYTATGQQVNLRTINEWQIFGALGAVRDGATYPATAQALEPSTALAIESKFLREMIQTRPYLSFNLMQLMTNYIQEMQSRYYELATEKVERRIARTILRLTAQMGVKNADGDIELNFTRQDLAEMSGTTLYTVSRVLSEWERRGLVEVSRKRVVLSNPHGIVQIAEELDESR